MLLFVCYRFPKPMPEKIRDQLNNGQLAVVPYEFCHHPELVRNEEKYIVNINQLSKVGKVDV